MERVMRIELTQSAWRAEGLPLTYTRKIVAATRHEKNFIMVFYLHIYYIIFFKYNQIIKMVENEGLEPLASSVQARRSSQLS